MGLTFRKLEVRDLRDIESLITENVESVEPGLRIIDASVLLGHARIDLVGLDGKDSLVLIALGFTANDEMLLRVLDGYSWCLEYPDTIRRLYPKARTKVGRSERPPRVIFIAEAMPDSFLRKVKQFGFPEVDCLRFLHLEVNGTAAVFFEAVEKLRRTVPGGAPTGESVELPQTIEQHPFIEGTPPAGATVPTNGNGAVHPASQPAPAEQVPSEGTGDVEQYKGEWQDFLKQLGSEPPKERPDAEPTGDLPVRPEVIDRISTLETTFRASTAGATRAPAVPEGSWLGGGEESGAPDHPENGSLTREWRDFLNQLKAAQ